MKITPWRSKAVFWEGLLFLVPVEQLLSQKSRETVEMTDERLRNLVCETIGGRVCVQYENDDNGLVWIGERICKRILMRFENRNDAMMMKMLYPSAIHIRPGETFQPERWGFLMYR